MSGQRPGSGSLPGGVSFVRASPLRLGPCSRGLRVRALEALTDRCDVARQILERLDGAGREREVVALPPGAGRAGACGVWSAPAADVSSRPRLAAARITEQLTQHPLCRFEELARSGRLIAIRSPIAPVEHVAGIGDGLRSDAINLRPTNRPQLPATADDVR